jgi:hypothetical protein
VKLLAEMYLSKAAKPSAFMIGSFSLIVKSCLESYPEAIQTTFSFVPQYMLPLCGHASAVTCLEVLLPTEAPLHPAITDFLNTCNFVRLLIDTIGDRIESGDDDLLGNLYDLLLRTLSLDEFERHCSCSSVVQFALRFLDSTGPLVQARQRDLLELILNDTTSCHLSVAIPMALSLFERDRGCLSRVEVAALLFLARALIYCRDSLPIAEINGLIERLARKFDEFPGRSIGIKAILEFMLVGLEIGAVRKEIMRIFFPVVTGGLVKENRGQWPFCLEYCRKVRNLCSDDECIEADVLDHEGMQEVWRTKVAAADSIIEKGWGDIPKMRYPVRLDGEIGRCEFVRCC